MTADSTTEATNWAATAAAELLAEQNADGGWPYYPGQAASTEATALVLLSLPTLDPGSDQAAAATSWLSQRQRGDGMFTASATHDQPSWVTPLAAMAMSHYGHTATASAAADALLAASVYTFLEPLPGVYGYDTTIPGWPWTPGDFSFLEPTALAVIFLKQHGQGATDRVRRAVDLLRNRFLDSGGWNYGEPMVLGGALFPTVAPTALALLALADEPDDRTTAGLSWLLSQRGQISSLLSLGWATCALNVWRSLDDDWATEVVQRWSRLPVQRRGPMGTSLCLLGLMGRENHPLAVG